MSVEFGAATRAELPQLVALLGVLFSQEAEFVPDDAKQTRALEKILAGSGECAETGWTFLGLSIAGWSLAWLVLLGVFSILLARAGMQHFRRRPFS